MRIQHIDCRELSHEVVVVKIQLVHHFDRIKSEQWLHLKQLDALASLVALDLKIFILFGSYNDLDLLSLFNYFIEKVYQALVVLFNHLVALVDDQQEFQFADLIKKLLSVVGDQLHFLADR